MNGRLRSDWIRVAVAAVAGLLLVRVEAAAESTFDTRLTCPRTASVGEAVTLDVRLENRSCTPVDVRLISTLVGNASQTSVGVGILGPVVANPQVTLPAATDNLPGTCTSFICDGSSLFCFIDADCVCRSITLGVANVSLVVPTPIPSSFAGTVATQLVLSDAGGGVETESDECLIAVPEPALELQLVCTMGVLAVLRHRASRAQRLASNRPNSLEETQS